MVVEKVFHEKSFEEKILPEYFFHLEQIFFGTNIHRQYEGGGKGGQLIHTCRRGSRKAKKGACESLKGTITIDVLF